MNYEDYTLETLNALGVHQIFKGCEYIVCGIEYLFSQNKHMTPDADIIYKFTAQRYFLEPTAVENSMRNVIHSIWTKKENPELMLTIFGAYNMDKRPSNLEFLILLFNYIQSHFETSETLIKLDVIWKESKRLYMENKRSD